MSKLSRLFAVTAVYLLLCASIVTPYAACEEKVKETAAAAPVAAASDKPTAVNVDNASCPICGDQIIPDNAPANAVKVEHEGKIYSMCCQSCASHFKKHPGKFARKVLQEMG